MPDSLSSVDLGKFFHSPRNQTSKKSEVAMVNSSITMGSILGQAQQVKDKLQEDAILLEQRGQGRDGNGEMSFDPSSYSELMARADECTARERQANVANEQSLAATRELVEEVKEQLDSRGKYDRIKEMVKKWGIRGLALIGFIYLSSQIINRAIGNHKNYECWM